MLTQAFISAQGYLVLPEVFGLVSAAALLCFACVWLLYGPGGRLFHVPGPKLCKISKLHLAFYDFFFCRNDQILKWHHRYGPVVCIAPNEVSVATLEATKDIYGATQKWEKSNYFDNFTGYGMRSVFATKPYEEHRAKRRFTSTFYQASTIYKLPELEQHIQERCQAVLGQIEPGYEVDVYSLTDWYALDNITYMVFGSTHCTYAVDHPCLERDIFKDLKHMQFINPFRSYCPKSYSFLSPLFVRLSSRLGYLVADEKLASWCQQRILNATADPHLPKSRSLLCHLLNVHNSSRSTQSLDHRYIAAEILDNINAAEATVAVTATYFIWRLTEAPRWQHQIRAELTSLPMQVDGSISFSDIDNQVPSLEACLLEVYRLHPASSGRAERIVPEGGHSFSRFFLPKGTAVTTSVAALHRDEAIFPDPDSFTPERWLEADQATLKLQTAQIISFGFGGRICLGKALAAMEIKLLIARLYLNHQSFRTTRSNAESMRQCSTHDAVPKALECVVRFQSAGKAA